MSSKLTRRIVTLDKIHSWIAEIGNYHGMRIKLARIKSALILPNLDCLIGTDGTGFGKIYHFGTFLLVFGDVFVGIYLVFGENLNQLLQKFATIHSCHFHCCEWSIFEHKLFIGAYPIKILQGKFYATLIFKHPDWLINSSSQSKCLKNWRSLKFKL